MDDDLVDGEHVGCEVRHSRDDLAPLVQLAHEEVLRLLRLLLLSFPDRGLAVANAHALAVLLLLFLFGDRHFPSLFGGSRRGKQFDFDEVENFLVVFAALLESLPDEGSDDLEDFVKEGSGAVEVIELVVEPFPEVLV